MNSFLTLDYFSGVAEEIEFYDQKPKIRQQPS